MCGIVGHIGLNVWHWMNSNNQKSRKNIYKLVILTKVSIFIYANSFNTDDLIQTYMCEVSASYTAMNKAAM